MPRRSSPTPPPLLARRRAERDRRNGTPAPAQTARAPASPPAPRDRTHERDLVPVCGLAAVEALFAQDPARVERLFFEPRLAGALGEPRRVTARARKPYREVTPDELTRISGTVRHGGVVAIARPRPLLPFDARLAADWAREHRPLLVLDGIGNPHNLGAIIRSAAYFGIRRVILAERPDQALPSPASYRVAEGALEYVLLYRAPLPAAIAALRQGGFCAVGTALDRGMNLHEFRNDRPVALVLGNEEQGVDPRTLRLCDAVVTIRGNGEVQSLNVAAAAAILLHAFSR